MYTAKSLLKANYLNSADSATAETLRPLTPGPDSSQQQKTTSQRVNGHTASFSSFAQCAQVDTGQQGPEDAAALVQSSSPVSAAATAGQHLPTGQARLSYDVLVPDSASECSTPRRGKDRSGISQVLTASDRLYAAAPGSPADIAATLAVRPSQRAQQLFRQDSFDMDCQQALHSSRCVMERLNPNRRLTPAEAKDLAGAMDQMQACLEGSLARHATWVAGCQSWEQALMARLQGAEKVVAKACLARQEARGQLSLSRARQAANETCLAEKDAELAKLSRKVCQLEQSSREQAQTSAADHFDTGSWLAMLCHTS